MVATTAYAPSRVEFCDLFRLGYLDNGGDTHDKWVWRLENMYIIEYINCLFKYEETGKFERPKTIIWE